MQSTFEIFAMVKEKIIVTNFLFTILRAERVKLVLPKKEDSTNHKIATMVRKTHRGGIGAIGSAKASYFHPSEHIRTKFPNDYKTLRLENVTIVHDGTARVNHKEQRC